HVFLQLLLLWDFHMVWRLERWQRDAGPRVRDWLAALGEIEALNALAGLSFDNPGWAFPTVATDESRITARDLGHPLIAAEHRVGNDVEVGPPGTFLLVTGSNMSGKSTMLRAVGINAVLALAGGPVCRRGPPPPLPAGRDPARHQQQRAAGGGAAGGPPSLAPRRDRCHLHARPATRRDRGATRGQPAGPLPRNDPPWRAGSGDDVRL